jgi:hypothetical protein
MYLQPCEASVKFAQSVSSCARNNLITTEQIFIKFHFEEFDEKLNIHLRHTNLIMTTLHVNLFV